VEIQSSLQFVGQLLHAFVDLVAGLLSLLNHYYIVALWSLTHHTPGPPVVRRTRPTTVADQLFSVAASLV